MPRPCRFLCREDGPYLFPTAERPCPFFPLHLGEGQGEGEGMINRKFGERR
jgi:hypothetical protein